MGLSQPRGIYGVHSVTPYNRATGKFYGTLKVLKGSSISMEGTLVELMGGSNKFSWAVEDGELKCELSLKFGEFPNWLFTLFMGNAPTLNAAEANGSIGTLRGINGSLINTTTGVASVQLLTAKAMDVKFMRYVIVAVTATTFDVYAHSDEDFGRGTKIAYVDDSLKITTTPITLTSTPVEIPGTGVSVTGGSGTVAMNIGDSAVFSTRPQNTQSSVVTIGGAANQVMPEFGCIVMAQKRGSGEMFEVDVFRCKGSGFPLGFEQNAFAEAEVKVKAFYDSNRDGVMEVRHVAALY